MIHVPNHCPNYLKWKQSPVLCGRSSSIAASAAFTSSIPIATKSQTPAHLARLAQDRRIQSVTRLGKYLLLNLDRGILTMHFRLDGQLLWFSSAK